MTLKAGMFSILTLGPELYWEPHMGNSRQWGWIHPSLQMSFQRPTRESTLPPIHSQTLNLTGTG